MKYFRLSVIFLLIFMLLVLSSCTGNGNTSASESPTEAKVVDSSTVDEAAIVADSEDDSATATEKPDSKADDKATEPNKSEETKAASKTDTKTESKTVSSADAHVHSFVGTSCTQAGKCSCGATSAALGHNYTDATCTGAGTCTRCGAKSSALGHNFSAATCTAPSICKRCKATKGSKLGHNYSNGKCTRCGDIRSPLTSAEAALFNNNLTDEENAQALAVARNLVAQIESAYPNGPDFDKIAMAAELVSNEYYKGVHLESGNYYSTAYGVFVKRESSCAGCCRALGLVLSCMGYKWTHVNENQWQHQWVTVTVKGETIWADGQIGWAGYGDYPYA